MRKAVAILTMSAAFFLAAAEPQFGVQAGLSLPSGDLSDNGYLGPYLGGHARWYFGGGHGLMARADLTFYGSNNSISVTGFGVGADYTYHLDQRLEGLYFLAGLTQESFHTSYPGYSSNDNALGIDFGVGYDMDRHLGLQARYETHNLNHMTYSALDLGVTYSF
jgi:hypothetical protein